MVGSLVASSDGRALLTGAAFIRDSNSRSMGRRVSRPTLLHVEIAGVFVDARTKSTRSVAPMLLEPATAAAVLKRPAHAGRSGYPDRGCR